MNKIEIQEKILNFLTEIHIPFQFDTIEVETFLPGILIKGGIIFIKLTYPGDLLHEAGHIAVEKEEDRSGLNGNGEAHKGDAEKLEIGVILWSFAALKYLELDEDVVFHEGGYKDDGEWLVEEFRKGNFIGLPLLQWMQLTNEGEQSDENGKIIAPFPHMLKWLR